MEQLNLQGKTKTELAIEFIQEHEPAEGYFLAFSGGKDSIVLYDLTKRAGVKFKSYYSATGIDPPELVKFIRQYYPTVIFKHPKISFFAQIKKWSYPTKFSRWCCDTLKKYPCKDIPLDIRLMGIRAEESSKRAKREKYEYVKRYHITMAKPIFEWLEWEIWDYIKINNIPYCSLYDEGFDRLGCVICPFHSYKQHQIYRQRWPKYFVAFEKAMRKLWDDPEKQDHKMHQYNNTFDEFLNYWYRGK